LPVHISHHSSTRRENHAPFLKITKVNAERAHWRL